MKKYLIYCLLLCLGACRNESIEPNEPYYRIFDLLQYGERGSGKEFPIISGILPLKNGNVLVWKLIEFGTIAFEVDKQGKQVRKYNLNNKYPNQFALDYRAIAYLEERDGGLWGMDWGGRLFTDKNPKLGYIANLDTADSKSNDPFALIHWVSKLSNGNYLVMLKTYYSPTIDVMLIDPNGKEIKRENGVVKDSVSLLHAINDRTLAYPNTTTWEDKAKNELKCMMSRRLSRFSYRHYLVNINLTNLLVKVDSFKTITNNIGEGWVFGYQNKFFTCFVDRQIFAANFIKSSSFYIENENKARIVEGNTPIPLYSSGTDLFVIPHKEDLYVVHSTKEYNVQVIKYSGLDTRGLPIERKRKDVTFGFLAYLLNAKISEEGDLFLLIEPTADETKVGLGVMKIPKEEL